MGSINRVTIMGLIGSQPQLKFARNGKPFVSLSLATHKRVKNEEGMNLRETQWHQVMLWGKNAELCSTFCEKGGPLYVEGHLSPYKKEENGVTTYHVGVVADQIQFIPGTKMAKSAERGEFEAMSAKVTSNLTPSSAPSVEFHEENANSFN